MKTVFNKVLLLLIVSLFITTILGCEAEREIVNDSPRKGVNIKRVTNKEIQRNPRLMQVMNRFKAFQSDQSISRIVYDSISGLYFDDEKGLYISNESKHSYTFPIIKLDPNQKVENICFNLNENGDYDVYLVKYDFTKTEYQNLTEEQLRLSESDFVPLLKDGNVVQTLVYACVDTYGWVVTEPVPLDQGDLTGNFGYQGGTNAWVIIATNCFFVNSDYTDPEAPSGGTSGTFNGSDVGGNNSGTGILTGGLIDDTEVVQADLPIVYLLGLYTQTLSDSQEEVYNSHPQMKDYLLLTNCSQNSMNFITQLIDDYIENSNQESVESRLEIINLAVSNDNIIEFNSENNSSNSQVFNSLESLGEFLEDTTTELTDIEYENPTDQNGRFGIFKLPLNTFGGIMVKAKINGEGNNYSISNVTSNLYGIIFFSTWVQDDYEVEFLPNNKIKIIVSGHLKASGFLDDLGLEIYQNYILTIIYDKGWGIVDSAVIEKR